MKKWQGLILIFFAAALIALGVFTLHDEKNDKEKFSDYSFDYFDTVASVTGYAENREEFQEVCDFVFSELEKYHKLYNIYFSYDGVTNLCDINMLENGAHRELKVDSEIINMLSFASDIHDLTGGKTNVAFGAILSIWHSYRENALNEPESAEIPPFSILSAASENTDIKSVIINTESGTVFISDPKVTLDVGAVAKGYAVERVAKALSERGITGYVINIGGNVRTIGTKADGGSWLVGIENPNGADDEPYLATLGLCDMAVATSGNYQRFYEIDGVKYHHIIDPETLMPADRYTSVTVVCDDAGLADALSTALFCMSFEEGNELIKNLDCVEAMWLTSEGEKMYSDEFIDYFEN